MFLSNIFKKNKKRFVTQELISLNALAKVPDIDYFKDNNQFLLLINLRKKEYLETLIKEKVLTSSELKSDELQNKLNMLHSLIEQNTLGNELFEKVIFAEQDKVKALIILRKFAIYNEKIKELEEEIVSRIIALKEILNRTFLNKHKRISIINEINRLTNVFIILMNQKETLKVCLSNYGKKCFDITKERDKDQEDNLIRKRKKELNEYQKQAFGKKIIKINNLSDMAKVEVALEEYVYNYKQDVSFWEEITIFCYSIEVELNTLMIDYNKVYKEILEFENKYKIFYEFGKNIINKEDLKRLYRLKFKFFTTWRHRHNEIKLIEPFINEKTTKLELETYEELIYEKIEAIRNYTDSFYGIQKEFGKDALKLLRLLKQELQVDGKYNALEILKNKFKLNLLMAFSKPIQSLILGNIYKKIYVKKCDYPEVNFYEPEFTWNDYLPLETINELKLIQNQKKDLGLYLFLKKYSYEYQSETFRYTLPEGLKIINNIDNMSDDVRNFINILQKNMEGKDVIIPSTLKRLEGNIFESTPIRTLILNDELERCWFDFLPSSSIQCITIPTKESLFTGYNLIAFWSCKCLRTVEFKNFDQWKFYNDIEGLKRLLESFITIDHLVEDTNVYDRIEKRYEKIRTYKLIIDKIIFTFSEGEIVEINKKNWKVRYMSTYYDILAFAEKINKELTDGRYLKYSKRKLTKH